MRKLSTSLFTAAVLSIPSLANAQSLINPLGTTDIPTIVGNIISAILGLVGVIALVMFVWGGLLWMTSAGNPERVEKGKKTLIWATIGIVVIFSAYALVNTVIQTLANAQGT